MQENILGKKLLIVVAHPDDESFLAAGTLHLNHREKGTNYLLCASKGELGVYHLKARVSETKIKTIRKGELMRVAKYLKVHTLKILNLPDGALHRHKHAFEKEEKKFILRCKPYYIVGFGENGYTCHKDHIAAGEVSRKLGRVCHIPFVEFVRPPRAACGNLDKYLVGKRQTGNYRDKNTNTVKPNIKIKINPVIKLKALSMHKSQFAGLNPYKTFPQKVADHILANEYFRVSKF